MEENVQEVKQEIPRAPRDNSAALEKARATRAANILARKEAEKSGHQYPIVVEKIETGASINERLNQESTKGLWVSAYVASLQSCGINHPTRTAMAVLIADQAVKDFETKFGK